MNELLKEIANEYGTPVYVYFESVLEERALRVLKTFEGVKFLPTVAVKANNNPHLLSILSNIGFGADVLGEGELYACKLAGISPEKIIWNGNGKTKEQQKYMEEQHIGYVNVDSVEEFEELWKNSETNMELFLRVNPDVDPKTHPYISTGLKIHKFGMSFQQAEALLSKYRGKISGFHIHIGSQILEVAPFKEAIEKTINLAKKYEIKKINIGGGWGVRYKEEEKELDLEKYRKVIIPLLQNFELVLNEVGRFIFAPAGVLLTKVVRIKETEYKNFIVVDTGMNHLIRPSLYGAFHKVENVVSKSTKKIIADVVGPLCETGDFIVKEITLPRPAPGDIFVVYNVGAYGYSMANNYNGTLRPAEILVKKDGSYELIRKRESIVDLYKF
ncbi:diaminopimelate decarboxylase [Thermosipho ferrireducens]|uniref:Diaminopimelate decarboxylase n=1 Tax=Thermosipho ferrireducens TaxID=2571116 RepID=A0ABX7SAW3_9BACT|nr:diaminopimelate decarboxylase [Thermosipho ferrireducens]QTA38596.1 diaminopimelate decarboxylase [Thermosipho ferrireducens]